MQFVQKYRFALAAIVLVVVGGLLAYMTYDYLRPVPDNTAFKSRYFSFTYPRIYNAEEYARGVVSVGHKTEKGLDPLIEVVRYQSDPDTALPGTFDAFVKRQASALCGADGPAESIACTEIGVTAATSTAGYPVSQLNLTLVRKNLKSGTTTSSTYGPMYVFNTTAPATPERPLRYSAIFLYPALPAFLQGTTSPMLMQQIAGSFKLSTTTSMVGE